jgi:hypothetical protein
MFLFKPSKKDVQAPGKVLQKWDFVILSFFENYSGMPGSRPELRSTKDDFTFLSSILVDLHQRILHFEG